MTEGVKLMVVAAPLFWTALELYYISYVIYCMYNTEKTQLPVYI